MYVACALRQFHTVLRQIDHNQGLSKTPKTKENKVKKKRKGPQGLAVPTVIPAPKVLPNGDHFNIEIGQGHALYYMCAYLSDQPAAAVSQCSTEDGHVGTKLQIKLANMAWLKGHPVSEETYKIVVIAYNGDGTVKSDPTSFEFRTKSSLETQAETPPGLVNDAEALAVTEPIPAPTPKAPPGGDKKDTPLWEILLRELEELKGDLDSAYDRFIQNGAMPPVEFLDLSSETIGRIENQVIEFLHNNPDSTESFNPVMEKGDEVLNKFDQLIEIRKKNTVPMATTTTAASAAPAAATSRTAAPAAAGTPAAPAAAGTPAAPAAAGTPAAPAAAGTPAAPAAAGLVAVARAAAAATPAAATPRTAAPAAAGTPAAPAAATPRTAAPATGTPAVATTAVATPRTITPAAGTTATAGAPAAAAATTAAAPATGAPAATAAAPAAATPRTTAPAAGTTATAGAPAAAAATTAAAPATGAPAAAATAPAVAVAPVHIVTLGGVDAENNNFKLTLILGIIALILLGSAFFYYASRNQTLDADRTDAAGTKAQATAEIEAARRLQVETMDRLHKLGDEVEGMRRAQHVTPPKPESPAPTPAPATPPVQPTPTNSTATNTVVQVEIIKRQQIVVVDEPEIRVVKAPPIVRFEDAIVPSSSPLVQRDQMGEVQFYYPTETGDWYGYGKHPQQRGFNGFRRSF